MSLFFPFAKSSSNEEGEGKMKGAGWRDMLAVFRSCHKHLGGLCELRCWPRVPAKSIKQQKKEWQNQSVRDGEAARRRLRERRSWCWCLLLPSGKHWAYASSFPVTPGTQLGGQLRHSWRHNGRERAVAGSAVNVDPA